MKRVVVTGATSMIGVALIKECIRNDIEVLAIVRRQSTRMSRLPISDLVKICECELWELDSIDTMEKTYDVFYHFAWSYTSKENRDNPVLQEKNIDYTLKAVDLAHRLGCQKFIGAGSQAEYGKVDGMIRPDTRVEPLISYGIAKYAAGKLSRKLCDEYGVTHIWGRIFNVYGRYDNEGTMLTYAIDQFLGDNTAIFSAGTQMWDYLYEDDAGKIFFFLGEKAEESKVYCIADGNARPLKDYILMAKQATGSKSDCVFKAQKENIKLQGLQADISELVQDIGYKPATPFKVGVSQMISYRKTLMNEEI